MTEAPRPRRELMTERDLQAWVLRRLGAPQLAVELHPADLEDVIEDAKEWYIAYKGVERKWKTPVVPGQVTYHVPDDVDTVLNVILPGSRYDLRPYYDPAAMGLYTLPADFVIPRNDSNVLSGVYQRMQYYDVAKRIFSIEPDWVWDEVLRELIITPPPSAAGDMLVTYRSTTVTLEQLSYYDYSLVKRFVLASAKLKLGRVRSKHPSFPGVQSERSLDGEALISEAQEELDTVREELKNSAISTLLLVG